MTRRRYLACRRNCITPAPSRRPNSPRILPKLIVRMAATPAARLPAATCRWSNAGTTTLPTPILVLGTGNRCGSTLIQRLLSSHPDVLIWGEHGGQLSQLLAAGAGIHDWSNRLGSRARAMFADGGYQSFMANLLPENKH